MEDFKNFRAFLRSLPIDSPVHDLHWHLGMTERALEILTSETTVNDFTRAATQLRDYLEEAGFIKSALVRAWLSNVESSIKMAKACIARADRRLLDKPDLSSGR